jgi:hypothetical protein
VGQILKNPIAKTERELRLEKALNLAIKIIAKYGKHRALGCGPKGDHDDPSWCDEGCGDYGKAARLGLLKIEEILE